MTTRRPLRIAGIRYARVLPVPVPASMTACWCFSNARSTTLAISSCEFLNSYPAWRFSSSPPAPKIPSTLVSPGFVATSFFGMFGSGARRSSSVGAKITHRQGSTRMAISPSQIERRASAAEGFLEELPPVGKVIERSAVRVIENQWSDRNGAVPDGGMIGVRLDVFGELLLV